MTPIKLRERIEAARDQKGMTVIEMVIALSIIATSFLALSFVLFGALDAYAAARTRSAFTEIGNAEIEEIRSLAYEDVGVRPPDLSEYDGSDQFEGRDAVVVTSIAAPPAVSVITTSNISGLPLPYTVRRWITWTDPLGGTGHVLKRIAVRVEWREESATRTFRLTSLLYPGGLGAPIGNPTPTATLTATPIQTLVGNPISFDGSGSFDPAGEPLTYFWDFGDGVSFLGGSTVSHTYSTAGTYTAELTVFDPHGGYDVEIVDLSIGTSSGNFPPNAAFNADPAAGNAPLTVNFDGSPSTDPNGDPLTYSWDWGDGTPNGLGVSAGHQFATAGTYSVVLTVTDTGGLSDTALTLIVVTDITCQVTGGYFLNPEPPPESLTNPRNDIDIKPNSNPEATSFTFYATTNLACTQVKGRIQLSGSDFFEVVLTLNSTSGSTKNWKGTASVSPSADFVQGVETGEIRGSGSSGPEDVFTFGYVVHQ